MAMHQKIIGNKGEDMAAHFLRAKGYKIIKNNYTCRYGEIDLIAERGGETVFVEVKTRSSPIFGEGEEGMNFKKRSAMKRAIFQYLNSINKFLNDIRCDVIAIRRAKDGRMENIEHIENISLNG